MVQFFRINLTGGCFTISIDIYLTPLSYKLNMLLKSETNILDMQIYTSL